MAGVAMAGKMLSSKNKGKPQFRLQPKPKQMTGKALTVANPLHTLFRGLTSTLSQITKKPVTEDYNAIVRGFIPSNAKHLIPQYPASSREVQLADLDGDSQNELITSFKHNNEVRTIILKKQNGLWNKAGEINHSAHDTINYRDVADVTGKGKKQLLISLTSTGKTPALYGYSFENSKVHEMFSRSYHRLEVLNQPQNGNAVSKAQLAIWDKKDNDAYNVEVLHWNGSKLEPIENNTNYYYKKVAPYYAKKVKQTPYTASSWYNLAHALTKAGSRKDALIAVEVGMRQDPKSEFKEKFLALRNEIAGK
jgi:hypothetical protein